jgi:hypothetical protein
MAADVASEITRLAAVGEFPKAIKELGTVLDLYEKVVRRP